MTISSKAVDAVKAQLAAELRNLLVVQKITPTQAQRILNVRSDSVRGLLDRDVNLSLNHYVDTITRLGGEVAVSVTPGPIQARKVEDPESMAPRIWAQRRLEDLFDEEVRAHPAAEQGYQARLAQEDRKGRHPPEGLDREARLAWVYGYNRGRIWQVQRARKDGMRRAGINVREEPGA